MTAETVEAMAARIRGGDRRALARAITLVESGRADHREQAEALLEALAPAAGGAIRIGISGPPGVGKSTFIEAFGLHLTGQGHRVAVLAVDPSSQRSGGSILGDKTRMELLTRDPAAFIRPSPAGATLGGVARRTRETMLLCEAAGYDVVVVETVGVGQSETAVAQMVDVFLLLLLPGAGDELQGIKRGIVEVADILVVNKADREGAERTADELGAALALRAAPGDVPVLRISALTGVGVPDLWRKVSERGVLRKREPLEVRRRRRARYLIARAAADLIAARVRNGEASTDALADSVLAGIIQPLDAAVSLLGAGTATS